MSSAMIIASAPAGGIQPSIFYRLYIPQILLEPELSFFDVLDF